MQSIGKKGEDQAVEFLKEKGYKILERNYRFKKSEVDLICQKEDLLIFVEVKARRSKTYGYPESFVSANQQKAIIRASQEYVIANSWKRDIRFDIVAILELKGRSEVEHFKDAFY